MSKQANRTDLKALPEPKKPGFFWVDQFSDWILGLKFNKEQIRGDEKKYYSKAIIPNFKK